MPMEPAPINRLKLENIPANGAAGLYLCGLLREIVIPVVVGSSPISHPI